MKHTMTLYIATQHPINSFMSKIDLKPNGKWFVTLQTVNFETTTLINDDYFNNYINKSFESYRINKLWFPAIEYQDNFYHHPSVTCLSDGMHEMFVTFRKK